MNFYLFIFEGCLPNLYSSVTSEKHSHPSQQMERYAGIHFLDVIEFQVVLALDEAVSERALSGRGC